MNDEQYHNDGVMLIRMSSNLIKHHPSKEEIIQSVLFLALGLEKVFKSYLIKINPVIILQDGDWKNVLPVLYDNLLKNKDYKVINKSPDSDTISFREAIQRASLFLDCVNENRNFLHMIRKSRDTIAHCSLEVLNYDALTEAVLTTFIPFIKLLEHETCSTILEKTELSTTADVNSLIKPKQARFERIIQFHKKIILQKSIDVIDELRKQIAADSLITTYTCPICSNPAHLEVEADYEYDKYEGVAYAFAVYPVELNCSFCELHLTDYHEFDYFQINL